MNKVQMKLTSVALALGLAACGSSEPSNPNVMTFKVKAGEVTAKYVPSGFSQNDVKRVVSTQCNGGNVGNVEIEQLSSYSIFHATCTSGGTFSYSFGEAEKTSSGILIETTFSDSSGKILYDSETI